MHSANYVYKIFTHILKWKSATVIIGTKAPCVLASRSDSFDNKFNSIVLSLLYSEFLLNKNN